MAVGISLVVLAVSASARADPPPPGLVAAYAFDEGAGAKANDASGNGHFGEISGATWASGRYGGALSFDGSNDSVLLGGLGTFYQSGFTLEAWVNKTSATENDAAVVGSWTGSGPMIWVDHLATRYHLTLGGGYSGYLNSGQSPLAGEWQHLAATYDGTTARFYIDGAQVASRTNGSVGNSDLWRIGAYGGSPGGFFDGLIDDVRIYDHALSGGEIQDDMDEPVSIANGSAPTMPGNFSETATTETSISVGWDASTDNHGVSGYIVYVNGAQAATTTETSFTITGLKCSTAYRLGVEAFDSSGYVSPRALRPRSTAACTGPGGLVAAYAFDEGAGAIANDASGNGHFGEISGATWASGRYGGALSFDGNNDSVLLGSLGTFYQSGFTLEAWVNKTSATENDAAVVGTWTGSGPMIWVDHLATRYHLTLGGGYSGYLDSGQSPLAGQWQHLAATYDGTTARFYIDGAQVASRTNGSVGSSDLWRIGAYGGSPGGFFDGLIDDVRIYDHALSGGRDPGRHGRAPATARHDAPDGAGVARRDRWPAAGGALMDRGHRRRRSRRATQSTGRPPPASRRAKPTGSASPIGTSYTDIGLPAGTYFYRVTARDAAGNVGPATSEASATASVDTTAPTIEVDPLGSVVSGPITVTATADDDQGLVGVQFKLNGENLGAEDRTSPYSVPWDTRGEVNGTHVLSAVARDGAANSTTSAPAPVTRQQQRRLDGRPPLAYGFDEGTGALLADSSGNNKTGTITAGTWTSGRYGGAVSLDGAAGKIEPPPLGLFYRNAFTYEAWVFKQGTNGDVAVVGSWVASQSGGAMIWVDHATARYRLTLGGSFSDYLDSGRSPALGRWQHVAATYDGTTARMYIDGDEVASKVFSGNVGSSNAWRIGAYGLTPTGFFDGSIDDVRIYDRALSASDIAAGMATRIQPDMTPPTVTSSKPSGDATDVSVSTSVRTTFSEPMRAATFTADAFELRDEANNVVPDEHLVRPHDELGHAQPSGRADLRDRVHRGRQGRRGSRPRRKWPDGRRHLVLHDPGDSAAGAARALAGESVRRCIWARSFARRASTSSRRSTSRSSRRSCSRTSTSSCSARRRSVPARSRCSATG